MLSLTININISLYLIFDFLLELKQKGNFYANYEMEQGRI